VKIFSIGKYLNIIKECGKIIYCPYEAEFEKLLDLSLFETENFNNFSTLINNIYEWSNLTLMNLIFQQENVISLFSSIKKVFFMESGDFYNFFINSASGFLNKEIIKDNIPFKKIENIIENAIRSTSLNNDAHKDLFYYSFSLKSIGEDKIILRKFNEALESNKTNLFFELVDDLSKNKKEEEEFTQEIYMSLNDYKVNEALVVNMKVNWPLSLIISKKSLIQYRIIFRLLMLCKHAENRICEMWSIQQNFKEIEIDILKPSFFLRDKMIAYLKNLIYFIFSEVIEPNSRNFIENLNKSKSLEEIIQHHNFFLETCFKQCLLDKTELLELMLRINNAIIYFSNLFIRFYNSIFTDVNYSKVGANISRKLNVFERKRVITQEQTKIIRNFFLENKTTVILSKFSNTFESFLREFLEKLNKE
jgi:gamma-tubulin complex component 2